jgi:hypothetical protein
MTQAKLGPGHPIDVDKLIESRLQFGVTQAAVPALLTGKTWRIP